MTREWFFCGVERLLLCEDVRFHYDLLSLEYEVIINVKRTP